MQKNSLLNVIFRGGVFKAVHSVSFFLIPVMLARSLTIDQFGTYNIIHTSILLLSSIVYFGFPEFLIKHASRAGTDESVNRKIFTIYFNAIIWIVLISILFFTLNQITMIFPADSGIDNTLGLLIGITSIAAGLTILNNSVVRVKGRLLSGQISDQVIVPIILTILLAITYVIDELTLLHISFAYLTAFFFGFIFSIGLVWQLTKIKKYVTPVSASLSSHEIRSILYIALLQITVIAQIHFVPLALAYLSDIEQVAFFRTAFLLTVALIMVMHPINLSTGPLISKLYERGDLKTIAIQISQITRKLVLFCAVFSLPIIFFRYQLIESIFGEKYIQASTIVPILTISNLLSVVLGPTTIVLVMTDDEKYIASASLIAVVSLSILLYMFTPYYGAIGAAWSVLASVLTLKLMLWYRVKKRLGIDCSVLAKHRIKAQ